MAKRPPVALTKPTGKPPDTAAGAIPATGRTIPVGVGLKESEVHMLDEIGQDVGLARNALMRYAVRFFLREYIAGRVDLAGSVETETKRRLRMP